MPTNPKDLQQLKEAKGGASQMEWSTVSNVHGGGAAMAGGAIAVDATLDLVKQLQTLAATKEDAVAMDWSTISNVHN